MKQLLCVFEHDVLHPDIARLAAGQIEHVRQRGRQREHAEHLPVLVPEHDAHVDHLVGQMRERVLHVHNLRREHRRDGRLIILLDAGALVLFKLPVAEVADVVVAQQPLHLVEERFLLLVQRAHRVEDGAELLPGRHAGLVVHDVRLLLHEVEQAARADHEKFVQVARKDGDEFQPFEQRHRLVHRLAQDAVVEPQPGQLPVLCITLPI